MPSDGTIGGLVGKLDSLARRAPDVRAGGIAITRDYSVQAR
jgi:hypothetical protein